MRGQVAPSPLNLLQKACTDKFEMKHRGDSLFCVA
jgi:hypothetical protein